MIRRVRAPLARLASALAVAVTVGAGSAAGPSAATASARTAAPLALEAVLVSAERHFPLLHAAALDGELRRREEQSALGAFDTRLRLEGDLAPMGFYERYTGEAALEQQTTLWGSRAYARYRYGQGDFPSYAGGEQTNGSGEVSLGVELPLLRDRSIDEQRARLRSARIDVARFGPEFALERISLLRDASVAYWNWVAAGEAVRIARRLLSAADERQAQIAGRVERGNEPEIDLVDNRRLVLERQTLLRGAERDLRQAAIRLSLFHRDDGGAPVVPEPDRLPDAFPPETPLDPARVEADIDMARRSHPILQRLSLQREKLDVEVELARNRMLPSLDVAVEGAQDFGGQEPGIDSTGSLSSDPRGSTEVKARVRLAWPVQLREARGEVGAARIRLRQIERRIRFAEEQLIADVRAAVEALDAAYEQTGQARENTRLAQRLRDAELRKLSAGLSNLIDVNIREVQAATAERQLAQAQASYFRALADYEASIADAVSTNDG